MQDFQPIIPILSLPSVVLFPRSLVSLQLPDELSDIAMGEWLTEGAIWGVATQRTDGETSTFPGEYPQVFRTVGIGCVVHRERENGRMKRLVIEGMARGKILDPDKDPCPAVRVQVLRDYVNIEGSRRQELAHAFAEMVRAARRVAASETGLRDPIRRVLAAHPHPGVVADLLAHRCVSDTYARQCILDELDVCRRARLVQIQLARMVTSQSLQPLRKFR